MIQLKEEHKNLTPIELAKLTWYYPDNPLYKNPEPAILGLCGEVAEIMECYKKNKYKPNYKWLNCKTCNNLDRKHYNHEFIPIVISECGDCWYYLRILAWMYDCDFNYDFSYLKHDDFLLIADMYNQANRVLQDFIEGKIDTTRVRVIYGHLQTLVKLLGFNMEELTLINYHKLVLDENNHGWKDAR